MPSLGTRTSSISPVINWEKDVTIILLAYTTSDSQIIFPHLLTPGIKYQIQTHFHFTHTTLHIMLI